MQEKTIAMEHRYSEIDSLHIDFENNSFTLMLENESAQGKQKCYMFECLDIEDLATTLNEYAADLVRTHNAHSMPRFKQMVSTYIVPRLPYIGGVTRKGP